MSAYLKTKIVNDPVHGFINLSGNLINRLIEHPYLQRLRNIKQVGLTYLVYPGACHNRFQHALGAMHLMSEAIEVLKIKGVEISALETESALSAILLHDIGHGPFSHALEFSIVDNISHESISRLIMNQLNAEFDGQLDTAIAIFEGTYPKQFLHDLVSSQLDVDRLDYLCRDSFFSGVAEGMIGLDRIIKMLDVENDRLVVEAKGIYSVEKFLISRHLMYWQVYLHKTVVSAEQVMVQILRRAKQLSDDGEKLFASPSLSFFLQNSVSFDNFTQKSKDNDFSALQHFVGLSDCDIESAVKVWACHPDIILSLLCRMIVERKLFRVELSSVPFENDYVDRIKSNTLQHLPINEADLGYFMIQGEVSNKAYGHDNQSIKIKYNDGRLVDISDVSDMLGGKAFNDVTRKYMLCYPKIKKIK